MSLRRFCGWEPAEYTEHHPATDTTPARSITRREPEWDDGQRLWMLALAYYEATLCRRCGHNLHDTTSTEYQWAAEDPDECKACSALARAEKAFAKRAENDPDPIPAEALSFTVRRKPYTAPWAAKGHLNAERHRGA